MELARGGFATNGAITSSLIFIMTRLKLIFKKVFLHLDTIFAFKSEDYVGPLLLTKSYRQVHVYLPVSTMCPQTSQYASVNFFNFIFFKRLLPQRYIGFWKLDGAKVAGRKR